MPLIIGAAGVALGLIFDVLFISPLMSSGGTFLILLGPLILAIYGVRYAAGIFVDQ